MKESTTRLQVHAVKEHRKFDFFLNVRQVRNVIRGKSF